MVIKARQHRTREQNRAEALRRLAELVRSAAATRKKRLPTKPTAGSRKRRLEGKARRGRIKALRGRVME